jgi:hypothetical protein
VSYEGEQKNLLIDKLQRENAELKVKYNTCLEVNKAIEQVNIEHGQEIEILKAKLAEYELPPDKVAIHKDELDRMNRNMAEKDRQTSEVYEIMKFEQVRANKAIDTLNAVLLYGKECPQCKAQVIVTATFYSLAHEHGCSVGELAGMTIVR